MASRLVVMQPVESVVTSGENLKKQNKTWQHLKLDSSFQCSYSRKTSAAGLKTHYKVKGISVD